MVLQILQDNDVLNHLMMQKNPFFSDYYAFYSSWFGGITQNPNLMLLPIDDHMVHRGDAVFEAMKAIDGHVYLMEAHLDRLFYSADKISMQPLPSREHICSIILETLHVANHQDASIRLFLSRGPGNFSPNPYEAIAPQLYVVITHLHTPSLKQYAEGVRIGRTFIASKSGGMAQIKSCNYLPNVLMKKEAVDRQLDFVIGTDPRGFISESATENILIVDQKGVIIHPPLDYILKGTTMIRTCELAREHGFDTEIRAITIDDLISAREAMITGTSLNVLPVIKFEDKIIGDGKPGGVAIKLNELLMLDIQKGPYRTAF